MARRFVLQLFLKQGILHETNLSSFQTSSCPQIRFSCTEFDSRWPQSSGCTARQGASPSGRLGPFGRPIEAMGIPASVRLRKPREFQAVRSSGQRIHCGPFIFQCRLSACDVAPRLGVVASRRVGNAVKRNYGKRLFRELFRKHGTELPQGSELVVVLRGHFDRYSFQDLEQRLLRAMRTMAAKGAEKEHAS